jgi:hypothetical protein
MKAEFISIESHLGGFLSCMISVRRERQESDAVAVSDRKTIQVRFFFFVNKTLGLCKRSNLICISYAFLGMEYFDA